MSDEQKLAVGDYVIAAWKTAYEQRWVRGEITAIKGSTVWVMYYYEHNDGGLTKYGVQTTRRRREEVSLTPLGPDELLPHAAVDARRAVAVARRKALVEASGGG